MAQNWNVWALQWCECRSIMAFRLGIQTFNVIYLLDHHHVAYRIDCQNSLRYYRQPEQILLGLSLYATCFGPVDHQA